MIVPADEKNLDAAAAVHAEAWRDSHRGFCSAEFVSLHTQARQKDYIKGKMNSGSRFYLLITDRPVGIVSVAGSLIEDLYVLPGEQNRGFGTALCLFAAAQITGSAFLWTLENNTGAARLYRRLGFRETGRRQNVSGPLFEIEWERKPTAEIGI